MDYYKNIYDYTGRDGGGDYTGTLPSSWSQLTNLQVLMLNSNAYIHVYFLQGYEIRSLWGRIYTVCSV